VSEQVALTKGWAREGGIGVSKGTHLGWASQGGGESEQVSSTHLWMGKLGREGIRVSKQHSPKMGKSGREGIRASGTHQRMGKGGRDRSEQGHSPRMGKLGREGIRASK